MLSEFHAQLGVQEDDGEEEESSGSDFDHDEETGQRLPLLERKTDQSNYKRLPRGHVPGNGIQVLPNVHKINEINSKDTTNIKDHSYSNGHAHLIMSSANNSENSLDDLDFLEKQIPKSTISSKTTSRGYPREILKTLIAFIFCIFSMFLTGISLSIVHEFMPETKPLPDQVLDRLTYQKWGLYASEYLLQIQTALAIIVMVFHKHRFIVSRRLFFVIGILYLYRSITMFVTVIPKSDSEYPCAPKSNSSLTASEVFGRAFSILTGFGLSVNGKHIYCGDFIYSGHTTILLIGYLVLKEYTPRTFYLLHWLCWVNAWTAIILLLLARGHYTVDVIIAYFITTRTWGAYHTLASYDVLKQRSQTNHFSTHWWFDAFRWFEYKVKAGKLPNEYNLPIPKKVWKMCKGRVRTSLLSNSRRNRKVASAIS